jgi:cyclopropane-fatty-acyl-phospholipid synthase
MADIKQTMTELFAQADVRINGDRPWDITVHNDRLFQRIISEGTLGAAESYMDGDWDCDQIDELLNKFIRADLGRYIKDNKSLIWTLGKAKIMASAKKNKAFEVGEVHYDTGNDLFEAMLDKRMVYTCAYWKNAKNLDEAQEAKLDLICRKVGLKKGMRVLDIGGGWGSFAKFAAEKYGVSVVNISVSKEQVALANERCKGLPVENRLMDYRDLNESEKFDRIISIGMFEHVNQPNYRTYFEVAHKNLVDDGLFLLHTIGRTAKNAGSDPFMEKYIFPNSMLPSIKEIAEGFENLFVMEDWHNFGPDYDKTLMAWNEKFEKHWPELKEKYGDRFYRMWRLYLLSCAGTFRARANQLWQIVLSKHGVDGGYESIR